MHKIRSNKSKKRRNTLKRVYNRGIKSLENNFSVKAAKNIINTTKVVSEPKVVTSSKIAIKAEKVDEKHPNYNEYKNRVIKQLKNN